MITTKYITFDARMINSSGIGTYIKQILPKIIKVLSNYNFNILGNINELKSFEYLLAPNINLIRFNSPIYSIQEQLWLTKLIPKNTNLYWSPHYNIPIFYKGKLLVSIMDVGHLALKGINYQISKRLYASFMFNRVKIMASAIIFISEFSKYEFNRLVGKPNTPQFVTLLGVDKSWQVKYSSKKNKNPYLLFVGNVKPHKNLRNLIDAFIKIKEKIPHDLFIVGKKEGFITPDSKLLDKAKKHLDRIKFTGMVSNDLLKQIVGEADVFVFPSIYEGFGLPPLEAMAAGTPVVASNAASIPEVCGDGALYFNPNDINDISSKILLMINNEELKSSYVKKGLLRVKKFNWNSTADKTIKIINEIL